MGSSDFSRTYRDDAVVLRTQKLAETDRIVILLTRKHGVVHAVARGVRKSSSRIGARLEPLMFVDVSLRSGKQLHTVAQVETKRAYAAGIMMDFDAYAVALVLTELVEQLSNFESEAQSALFDLLAGALSVLSRKTRIPDDVLNAFLLRSMLLAGWGISMDRCAVCGESKDLRWFSFEAGLLCEECARASVATVSSPVHSRIVDYMRIVFEGRWDDLVFSPTSDISPRVRYLLIRYVQWQLERPLKSVSLIEKDSYLGYSS